MSLHHEQPSVPVLQSRSGCKLCMRKVAEWRVTSLPRETDITNGWSMLNRYYNKEPISSEIWKPTLPGLSWPERHVYIADEWYLMRRQKNYCHMRVKIRHEQCGSLHCRYAMTGLFCCREAPCICGRVAPKGTSVTGSLRPRAGRGSHAADFMEFLPLEE